jgi:hypothetical protein
LVIVLAAVGQINIWVGLALELGEGVLDAASQASGSSLAILEDVLVDGFVVEEADDGEHGDRQEHETNQALVTLQSHMLR